MLQTNPFGAAAFDALQQQTRKNVAMFEQALSVWAPFAMGQAKAQGAPAAAAGGDSASANAAENTQSGATTDELAELRAEFARMQAKIEKLSKVRD
jgi:polyhydroxyalkanoate synthesis regulator protein